MKKISVWTALLIAVLLCLATFMTTFLVMNEKIGGNTPAQGSTLNRLEKDPTSGDKNYSEFVKKLADKFSEVDSVYRALYIGDLDDETLIDNAVAGYVVGTGDRFGTYFTVDGFEDFMSETEGEIVGVGIQAIYNPDYKLIEVLSVVKDSPADHAGVLPGDLVYTVGEDKQSVAELGYYAAIDLIRGEVGTTATFTVLRGDDYSDKVDFSIERALVKSTSVLYHVYSLDESVGVILITGFDIPTFLQFVDAVEALRAEGCEKLVVDLRNNPGGELNSVIKTLDYVLPEGPVLRVKDADGNYVETFYSEATELDMPMVCLINGNSASAAEIFAAAVQDYGKAKLVGTTSFGKGCMQRVVPLSDGSGVSVTYRLFEPPFSDSFHGIGIKPDVEVELDEALKNKNVFKITDEEDNQLAAAIAIFED